MSDIKTEFKIDSSIADFYANTELRLGSMWRRLDEKCKTKVFYVMFFFDTGRGHEVGFNSSGKETMYNHSTTVSDFLERHMPVVDDTFNDDTPAQTFNPLLYARFDFAVGSDKAIACDFFSFTDESSMRLIGIHGPARAGKDTLASYMLDNLDGTWLRSSFADPLKAMLSVIGVDCSDDAKAVIDDTYGATPRHMMQTLGTEWGRHMIDGDIWVKAFARLNAGKCVIVPDVRFENEADLVREHGVLIHLVGRGGIDSGHVSENALEFKLGDIVIDNSRDMAWLYRQVDGNAVLDNFVGDL